MPENDGSKRLRPWSPATYEIEVEGCLDKSWADRLGGMSITSHKRADKSIVTCLSGRVLDQSELMGIINGLANLHLSILLVKYTPKFQTQTNQTKEASS
jgi:hypothetical protein